MLFLILILIIMNTGNFNKYRADREKKGSCLGEETSGRDIRAGTVGLSLVCLREGLRAIQRGRCVRSH